MDNNHCSTHMRGAEWLASPQAGGRTEIRMTVKQRKDMKKTDYYCLQMIKRPSHASSDGNDRMRPARVVEELS